MSKINDIISLLPEVILGAEEDGAGQSNSDQQQNGSSDSGQEGTKGTENNSSEGEDENKDTEGTQEDGRTKALKAERKLKREAEAEAKRLRQENEALKRKDMDELQRTQAERDDAVKESQAKDDRLQKLITGYRSNALNNAILAEAQKQKFIDPNDALVGVDINEITVNQDEDDPTQVDIDLKAVTSAVKKLATSKPHYINKGTTDGGATGSQFGGSRSGNKPDDDFELRQKYPNL